MDNTNDGKQTACRLFLKHGYTAGQREVQGDVTPQSTQHPSGHITAPFQSEGVRLSVQKHMLIVLAEFTPDSMSNLEKNDHIFLHQRKIDIWQDTKKEKRKKNISS